MALKIFLGIEPEKSFIRQKINDIWYTQYVHWIRGTKTASINDDGDIDTRTHYQFQKHIETPEFLKGGSCAKIVSNDKKIIE